MAIGPCLNPNCKSNGKPHPNCHCYNHMAEGGEVSDYCSSMKAHNKDCQYYAEGGEVDFIPDDQFKPDEPSANADFIPDHQFKEDEVPDEQKESKYGSLGQQALTGAEGIAKGFAGPLATAAELGAHKIGLDTALGIDTSAEAQIGREEENPWTHNLSQAGATAGSFITGTGEAALIAKALPELKALGMVGSGIVRGFIENGLLQGGDEISKGLLGQGDTEAPFVSALAHMGMSGIMGGITGGIFGGVSKGLKAVEDKKLSNKAQSFLMGIGDAAKTEQSMPGIDPISKFKASVDKVKELKKVGIEDLDESAYRLGSKAHDKMGDFVKGKVVGNTAKFLGAKVGYGLGGMEGMGEGYLIADALKPYIEKIIDKSTIPANKAVRATVMKILSTGETRGMWESLKYASDAHKGAQKIANHVDSLFNAGGKQAVSSYIDSEKDRENLKKFVEDGGTDTQIKNEAQGEGIEPEPQAFAEGGQVQPNEPKGGLQAHLPAQNMMLAQTKGRVYNYLNSIRPLEKPKLPFDTKIKDHRHEHDYNRALDVANNPLSVIKHIHEGTILPDHVKHISQMYPELYSHLSKKITSKIAENNLKEDKKPSYKVRQGMSLLLGVPMDSSFTPQAILAAQPKPQQPPQQGQKMKGGKATTNSMVKQTKTYQTPNQAAENDRSSRD